MTATHASTGPLRWLPHAENFANFTRQSKIDGILGVLYDLELIDGKDWYAWGYKKLLPDQKNDGSWTGGGIYVGDNTVLNSCFALLFLKRANLVMDLTEKLQLLARLTGAVAPSAPAPGKKD